MLTRRFIDRYVKQGQKVLDIGGGPGRYALYLAEKGCDVTLYDLAEENVKFALLKAGEAGLPLAGLTGDARNVGEQVDGEFDHILLMGPLYHLLKEEDRRKAVQSAIRLLKPGGVLFASFISLMSGFIYAMKFLPECLLDPNEEEFISDFLLNKSFAGAGFTQAYFAVQSEILPFMEQFGLEKLHFFSQEGILSPCEGNIMKGSEEVRNTWLDVSEKICERPEYLSWGEHLMYVGRKPE